MSFTPDAPPQGQSLPVVVAWVYRQFAKLAQQPPMLVREFADDAAAAQGGVPIGGLYHSAGVAKVRVT